MTRSLPRPRSFALALVAGLMLTGCASDDATKPTDTGAATTDSSTAPAPAEEPAPAVAPEPEPIAPSECLLGEWAAENSVMIAYMASIGDAGVVVEDITGVVTLVFDPNAVTRTAYENWTVSTLAEGQQVTLVRNGVDTGTYAVENDALITMTETGSDSIIDMFMNGAPVGSVTTTNTLPLVAAAFTCDGDDLTLQTAETTLEFTRK